MARVSRSMRSMMAGPLMTVASASGALRIEQQPHRLETLSNHGHERVDQLLLGGVVRRERPEFGERALDIDERGIELLAEHRRGRSV